MDYYIRTSSKVLQKQKLSVTLYALVLQKLKKKKKK